MALFRDIKFTEGSGDVITDTVASKTLTPEVAGKSFNWGLDIVNGVEKSFLSMNRSHKQYPAGGVGYTWLGTPYSNAFFDGSNNLQWTVAIHFRAIMNQQGVIFNSQGIKLLFSPGYLRWGNGGDTMVNTTEFIRGKWVTLIFSSSDGNNVNVWFEDMTTAGMLRTFSKGENGARLYGTYLRLNAENTETNAGPAHINRLTFYTHEMSEAERLAYQVEQGGASSAYEFSFSNKDPLKTGFSYIWDERDSEISASWLDTISFIGKKWFRWRHDGGTCQSCSMGYVKRNLNVIWMHSKTYFPTDIDFVDGAFYTRRFRIFGLFNNTVDLAGDLINLQLAGDITTDALTLYEVRYRNSSGTTQILLDGRTITKGVALAWDMKVDFSSGTIDVWLNGENVCNASGLTLNIKAEFFGIGPWQGIHMNPAVPPDTDYAPSIDYTGGEYYETEQYIGESMYVPENIRSNKMRENSFMILHSGGKYGSYGYGRG